MQREWPPSTAINITSPEDLAKLIAYIIIAVKVNIRIKASVELGIDFLY